MTPWTALQIDAVEDALRERLSIDAVAAHVEDVTGRVCSVNSIRSIVHRTARLRSIGFPAEPVPDRDEPMAMIPPRLAPALADLQAVAAKPAVSAGTPRSVLELGARQCRFPVEGDGADTLMCGAAVRRWQPGRIHGCYCEAHARAARPAGD